MRRFTKFDPYEIGLDVRGFSGNEVICLCPFHADRNPSASMNLDSGLYFCFSCGAAATAYQLAQKLGGFVAATTLNIAKQAESSEWRRLLSFPIARQSEYLIGREVSAEQAQEYGIHEIPGGVAIEVRNVANVTKGVLIRRADSKPRYLYFGEPLPLWPLQDLHKVNPKEKVFVTEGVFGTLRGLGFGHRCFATMGAMIRREVGTYLSGMKVYGAFDSDFAGYVGAARLCTFSPSAKIIIPGQEFDELDRNSWQAIAETTSVTRSITKLAQLSGDKEAFYKSMPTKRGRDLRMGRTH